jgi:hypothetical protein
MILQRHFDDEDGEDFVPEFKPGEKLMIYELYRDHQDAPWDDWIPDDIGRDLEASSHSEEFALVVRREKHPTKNQLVLHSITIQSPVIREAVQSTFHGFEGINTNLRDLTFRAPFHSFYYRWHRFEKLWKDEQDEDAKNHLELLYQVISKEIVPHVETMEDLTQNGVITFDYLWAIFVPGMEVYTQLDGQDRVMIHGHSRYAQGMMGDKHFNLSCKYIDCDGQKFGYARTSLSIDEFEGVKKISDLRVIPSHFHPNAEQMLSDLHARGEKFEQLNGFHHVLYSGFYRDVSNRWDKRYVSISPGDCGSSILTDQYEGRR